jgi:hypothetical protein
MPRALSLAEQAVQFDKRSRSEAERRVARRSTFNSLRMWLLVAAVWLVAGAVLGAKLTGLV